jgi:hypothetical protein
VPGTTPVLAADGKPPVDRRDGTVVGGAVVVGFAVVVVGGLVVVVLVGGAVVVVEAVLVELRPGPAAVSIAGDEPAGSTTIHVQPGPAISVARPAAASALRRRLL